MNKTLREVAVNRVAILTTTTCCQDVPDDYIVNILNCAKVVRQTKLLTGGRNEHVLVLQDHVDEPH